MLFYKNSIAINTNYSKYTLQTYERCGRNIELINKTNQVVNLLENLKRETGKETS